LTDGATIRDADRTRDCEEHDGANSTVTTGDTEVDDPFLGHCVIVRAQWSGVAKRAAVYLAGIAIPALEAWLGYAGFRTDSFRNDLALNGWPLFALLAIVFVFALARYLVDVFASGLDEVWIGERGFRLVKGESSEDYLWPAVIGAEAKSPLFGYPYVEVSLKRGRSRAPELQRDSVRIRTDLMGLKAFPIGSRMESERKRAKQNARAVRDGADLAGVAPSKI
jgi:hypothetical protein